MREMKQSDGGNTNRPFFITAQEGRETVVMLRLMLMLVEVWASV